MMSLAAIRAQKEVPVNCHWRVGDFRATLWKSWTIRHQPGRPSAWSIIADKDASILAHVSHSVIRLEMGQKIGYPEPRLRPAERPQ